MQKAVGSRQYRRKLAGSEEGKNFEKKPTRVFIEALSFCFALTAFPLPTAN